MLQVALSQVRTHASRFIAVGLAVMLAVGFLTATLGVNATTRASLQASLGDSYAGADLVVSPGLGGRGILTEETLAAAEQLESVEAVYGQQQNYVSFTADGQNGQATLTNTAPTETLEPAQLLEGALPSMPGEVSVDEATAEQYGLSIGDQLTLSTDQASAGAGTDGTGTAAGKEATVVGIVAASSDPLSAGQPQFQAATTMVEDFSGEEQFYRTIQLTVQPGVDADAVTAATAAELNESGSEPVEVRTAEQEVAAQVAQFTGGTDQLTAVLLAFAAIAILVSGLVISNTFSVLIAQRTRELALLRCVGAGRGQIRLSVLIEAAVVALVSSVFGVLLAVGVLWGLVTWASTLPEAEFATLAVPPSAIITGILVGLLMTLVAALVPARAATAVAPLAALRPADDVAVTNRRGRVRLGIGLFLLIGGSALLAAGAVSSSLLIALPGGALMFIGVLMCATLFVPRVVAAFGKLAAPLGVPGKLAAMNSVRNPARTSSTASALLIGVTLVTMMMTGAATSRVAFDSTLDQEYPVALSIMHPFDDSVQFDADTATAALSVHGVRAAAFLPVAGTLAPDGGRAGNSDAGSPGEAADEGISDGGAIGAPVPGDAALPLGQPVLALDATAADAVLRDSTLEVNDSTIIMPSGTQAETLAVIGSSGELTLDVVTAETRYMPPLVSTAVMNQIGGPLSENISAGMDTAMPAPMSEIWLGLDPELSSGEVMDLRTALAESLGIEEYLISGAAVERAAFNEIIDVLLLVVTGLLAVAVLIALIGVANTLSLSVLERTRESSLLRALGLTRNQLRGMLAVEAVLIAGVAALIGTALGVLYGWLGAQSAIGLFATVTPVLPWLQLLGVVAVAVLAGLLASVMPARRAARLSPVEGLAME